MSDPWARQWEIYSVAGAGPNLGPGKFTLEAVPDPVVGDTAFYRVSAVSAGMPQAAWLPARFFPRGSNPPEGPTSTLPKWDPSSESIWNEAATALRVKYSMPGGSIGGFNPIIQRLEGDIFPGGEAEALTIVRVAEGAEDGDFLVFILKSRLGDIGVREDGTAHGGPPH